MTGTHFVPAVAGPAPLAPTGQAVTPETPGPSRGESLDARSLWLMGAAGVALTVAVAFQGTAPARRAEAVYLGVFFPGIVVGLAAVYSAAVAQAAVRTGALAGRLPRNRVLGMLAAVPAALVVPEVPTSAGAGVPGLLAAGVPRETVAARVLAGVAVSPAALVAGVLAFGGGDEWLARAVGGAALAFVCAWAAAPRLDPFRLPQPPDDSEVGPAPAMAAAGGPATLTRVVVGAGVVALAVGLPDAASLRWIAGRPALAVVLAVLVAAVAGLGPAAGCFGALALAPLGVGAQVAFALTAAVADVHLLRGYAAHCGRPATVRVAVVAVPFAVAAGLWFQYARVAA